MLRLEGDKDFAVSSETLFRCLTDLQFLVRCIPDVAEVKEVTERSASLVIRPGFSFLRGELQLTLEKLEETAATSARFRAKTKGIGTTSEVEAGFQISTPSEQSHLHWVADVQQLGGLLKAVPRGLIKAAAQKVIGDVVARIEQQIGKAG